MKIRELKTPSSQRIYVTGIDIGAVAPQLREARVIDQDDYNIWRILTRVRPRGEVGFGVF